MQIMLASTNRAKLAATHAVAQRVFTQSVVQVAMVTVDVPHQPIGDEQTQAGAIARARAAAALDHAHLGVGLEGGLRQTLAGWALCSWAAVADVRGRLGVGGGGIVLLPSQVVERVLAGEELGPVMDELAVTRRDNGRTLQRSIVPSTTTDSIVRSSRSTSSALPMILPSMPAYTRSS